jgi:hypothetical protein
MSRGGYVFETPRGRKKKKKKNGDEERLNAFASCR